jgi:hypothetical protein
MSDEKKNDAEKKEDEVVIASSTIRLVDAKRASTVKNAQDTEDDKKEDSSKE